MDKSVFIINGSGGVGKDTFVNKVSDIYSKTMNFSSVHKVKEIAKLIGWNGEKTERDRRFLSDIKLLCTEYNDMPLKSMKEKFEEFIESENTILFLHIREPEEIEKAKQAFNAKTILIKRDSIDHITSNMADANVYNYAYDIIINNDMDIYALKFKALRFLIDLQCGNLKKEY